jgi:hypothetical protein
MSEKDTLSESAKGGSAGQQHWVRLAVDASYCNFDMAGVGLHFVCLVCARAILKRLTHFGLCGHCVDPNARVICDALI